MIKTGIYSIEGLINKNKTDFFGKTKNIAISLYNDLYLTDLPDKERLQEMVFTKAKLGRFYKVTYKNRFDDFDMLVNDFISEHYKNEVKIFQIHDAGVSDGRTSVEWYNSMDKQHINFYLTASDLCTELKIFRKNKTQVVFDQDNRILQVVVPPFVLAGVKNEHRFYLIDKTLSYFFFRKFRNLAINKNKFKGFQESIISQISENCSSYSISKNNFKFKYHNLFDSFNEKYDIIRVMNVLQQIYFTDPEHTMILKNIFNALEENGLFITGSNDVVRSPTNAGIYTRRGLGFQLIKKINNGSRIHDLIQDFKEGSKGKPTG